MVICAALTLDPSPIRWERGTILLSALRVPHFQIAFLLDEVVQERAEERGQGIGDEGFVIGVAWGRPIPVRRGEGDGPFVEELFFEGGALGELPNFHEMGGVGFGRESFFAEPVEAEEGRGARGEGRRGVIRAA